MHSKNAIGNLIKRYKAVLNKCNILNTFGSLMLASGLLLSPMLVDVAITKTNNTTITSGGFVASPSDSTLINNGNILGGYTWDNGFNFAGMYGSHANGSIDYFFTNTGTIDISNISSVTSGTDARAFAYGMYANGTGNHNLTNSGDIIVRAEGGTVNSNLNVAFADAYAYGMYADGTGNHNLTNSGDIRVSAQGGKADSNAAGAFAGAFANANANGMYADGTGNHMTNSGHITVTARGGTAEASAGNDAYAYADAYGMFADGTGNHNLTNSGDITVTAEGGTANSSAVNADAGAFAYGMFADGTGNHNLTNSGHITVTVKGGTAESNNFIAYAYARAIGMYAYGTGNHNLTNSGHIRVSAQGGTAEVSGAGTRAQAHAFAYGMYVSGTPTTEHLINNYGIINATAIKGTATGGTPYAAAHAFEVFGYNSYSVGTFATTLQPWTVTPAPTNGTADTVFGIHLNEKINFKNTTFILRPRVTAQGVELGKVYNVKDMIAIANGNSTGTGEVQAATAIDVRGNIASAIAEVPFLKATLTNGHDPLSATVRLDSNINDETTPGGISALQTLTQVQGQMSNITRELLQLTYNEIFANLTSGSVGLGGGSEIKDSSWSVFLSPYANNTINNKYSFDGSNMGITGGASYRVNDSFSLGAHFDFNIGDFNAEIMEMTSDSTSIAFGVHTIFNITDQWYMRAQATAVHTQTENQYKGGSGTPLSADNQFNTDSLYLAFNTGYVFEFTDNHSLIPEIGFSYLTTRTQAHDIQWSLAGTPMPLYDMFYDESHYSALYANINLTWRSKWIINDASSFTLLAGLGLRQNLSGNEIKSNFRTLGSPYSTTATEDMTTWIADVGLEYKYNDFSISLNYDGSYGTEQTNHGVSVMFKWDF